MIDPDRAVRLVKDLAGLEDQVLDGCGLNEAARLTYGWEWRRRVRPWLLGQLTADDGARQTEPGSP